MFKPGMFVWTTQRDYINGRSPIDDTLGAMGVACFKVNDGLEWQNYTPAQTTDLAQMYRDQGIDFHPWGVARGWYADWAYAEGVLAGQHAAAANAEYILDLEPYPEDYWQGVPGTAYAFCRGYESTSGGRMLRLCPDARNPGINLEEWIADPIVSYFHPQMYARAFNETQQRWVDKGIKPLTDLGVHISRIYPLLAAWYQQPNEPSISAAHLYDDIMYYADRGYPGVALWRREYMNEELTNLLLSMDNPFKEAPPVEPPITMTILIEDYEEMIAALEATRISLTVARHKADLLGS